MKVTFNFLIAVLAMLSVPALAIFARIVWDIPLDEMKTAMFIGAGGVGGLYVVFKAHGG